MGDALNVGPAYQPTAASRCPERRDELHVTASSVSTRTPATAAWVGQRRT